MIFDDNSVKILDAYLIIFDSEKRIYFNGVSKRGWDLKNVHLDYDYYNKAINNSKFKTKFNENHVYY